MSMLLPALIIAVADVVPVTFSLRAPSAKSVNVAGTFNNWNKDANPLRRSGNGDTWVGTVSIPYGRQAYKFVVDGATWMPDPLAKENRDDGNGNINSVLLVLPPDYSSPASPRDGKMATSILRHEPKIPQLNVDRGNLQISLRARPDDLASVAVVSANGKSYPMKSVGRDGLFTTYRAEIPWRDRPPKYAFRLIDGGVSARYGPGGLGSSEWFQLPGSSFAAFRVPIWVEQTVIYQIFPDRFADGRPDNNPPETQDWSAGKPTWFNRFGGDAKGVMDRAGYLQSLGIGAVYFNPVFQSPSNHRYDASDYKKIDPQFGTNAEFAEMTRDLQRRGIRTVLDVAFNHTATNFFAFQNLLDKGEASAYRTWYFPKSFPIRVGDNPNYEAWYGFPSLPKLNTVNPETEKYLLGVYDYWHQNSALAGVRLDVANEVDMNFWRAFRKHVKSVDANAWIVGEHWGDGNPWLGGDQWDSVMNYPFREAVVQFVALGKTSARSFGDALAANYALYVPQVSRNAMNLLSSHDTARFLTLAKGDQELQKLAAAIQFGWAGSPSIYYGEEVGMEGGPDPDNRRPMRWDLANKSNPMLAYYKRLIALRNLSPALQSGDPVILTTDDDSQTLAFSRTIGERVALVAVNRSAQAQTISIPIRGESTKIARGTGFIDALSGVPARLVGNALILELRPKSAAILLPKAEVPIRLAVGPVKDARPSSSNPYQGAN